MKVLKFSTIAIFVMFFVFGGCQPEMSPVEAPVAEPTPTKALSKIELPPGATLQSAALYVYQWYDNPGYTVTAYPINASWVENTVTWNNFGGYNASLPLGSLSTTGSGWKSITITSLVADWIANPNHNFGVLLRQSFTKRTDFISSDNTYNPTLHPRLEITYNLGGSQTLTIQRGTNGIVEDAFITELYPTGNYGSYGELHTGLVCAGDPEVCKEKYSLLRFDLTTCTGTIGNRIWTDFSVTGASTNCNGLQDAGEPGINGVTVQLKNSSGVVIQTVVTSGDGGYLFTNVCAGEYTVVVDASTLPSGYTATMCNDAVGVDNNSNCTGYVELVTDGQTDLTIDFGYCPSGCTASIGNVVWEEKTGDLMYEPGFDKPIEGVKVTLNLGLPGEKSVLTDAAGMYYFNGLCAGTYTVTVDLTTVPFGISPLMPCDDALKQDNNSNCNGVATTLVAGEQNWTIDFGFGGTPYCGPCPDPVGMLFKSIDQYGDLVVTYAQYGVNDNTYGTGSDWGHKFGDLVGSDKAEFIFKNASGNVVLDFLCDYISGPGYPTPSGYKCLGATGGDGSMVSGNAAWIKNATTSLDDNLNKWGYVLLVNSPAVGDPAYPHWNNINSYTVTIDKAAFGGNASSAIVAIGYVHDSPPHCAPNNRIEPVPCVGGPPSPCNLSTSVAPIKDRLVKVNITNNGTSPFVLSRVAINWPSENGKLKKIKLDGDVLYDVVTAPPSVDVTHFKPSDPSKYTVKAGETDQLIFEFERNADGSGYIIDVESASGCKFQVLK